MRKEGERRAGASIGAGKNGIFFFFLLSFLQTDARSVSWSVEPKSPVCPSACVRFKCPARCEERENPSPLSHDPTLVTYQVRMPASLAQPPRSRYSPHYRGAQLGHVIRTGSPTSAAPACHVEPNRSPLRPERNGRGAGLVVKQRCSGADGDLHRVK